MESTVWTLIDLLFDLPRMLIIRHIAKRVRELSSPRH
jgi:hypothetical protein